MARLARADVLKPFLLEEGFSDVTVFWRYWLLQIPGWGVVAVVLLLAHRHFGLSTTGAAVLFALWFLKDVAIYPLLKKYYDFRAEEPASRLFGERGVAQEALRPSGYVRLRGELWLAEIVKNSEPVEAGDEVVVESVDGLTLRVRRPPPRSYGEPGRSPEGVGRS